ncbi:MAG: hypothetical protein JW795_19455 [Chitinivibrionales bacterium]|nr:hypothetical protein [Chitinivibrionales bacterium]
MKKQCVIVSVLLFIVGATAMPQFSLQETSSGYTIELKVPALEIADVTVNALRSDGTPINETFASISIPGFHTGGDDFGCPQTILSGFQLAAEDANVSIEVRDVRQQTYSISKRIYPIQKPVPYCTTPAGETPQPFVIEEAAYRSTPKRSAAAFIREMYDFRGMKGIDVTISPMSYDPLQNSITVVTSMTLTITMKKPTRIDAWGSHVWSEAMRSIFKNLDGDLGRAIAGEPVSAEKYLIITNTTFKDNEDLAKFVQYRQKQGLSVEVVEKSAAGTTKENFTTFIRGKKPTYCILIGGPSDYPNYTVSFGGYTAKSYTPYVAATSSNPKPDIALGLWFTNNASGITNIVKKTIETEASCDKMPKKIMAIGGHSGSSMSDSESGKTLPANHCDVIAEEMYTQYFKNQGYSATLGFCTRNRK